MAGRQPTIQTLTLTDANTEYSLAIASPVSEISIQCRTAVDVRMATATGKVAGSTNPFATIKAGGAYSKQFQPNEQANDFTLYFASASAGVVLEIMTWDA